MNTDTNDEIPVTILSGSLGLARRRCSITCCRTPATGRWRSRQRHGRGQRRRRTRRRRGSELELDDGVAELSNGCICCELQDDLETAVVRLARDRSFDHLVVESSGISEPAPVARLFTTESRVAALYDVDTLVTVLDTPAFLEAFAGRGAAGANRERGRPSAFGSARRAARGLEPRLAEQGRSLSRDGTRGG